MTEQVYTPQEPLADQERKALRLTIEKLERERDEARAEVETWKRIAAERMELFENGGADLLENERLRTAIEEALRCCESANETYRSAPVIEAAIRELRDALKGK